MDNNNQNQTDMDLDEDDFTVPPLVRRDRREDVVLPEDDDDLLPGNVVFVANDVRNTRQPGMRIPFPLLRRNNQ